MPVFQPKVFDPLEKSVREIAYRFFARTMLRLSPSEFVLAFINPDHVAPLRTTEEIVGLVGTNSSNHSLVMTSAGQRMNVGLSSAGAPPIIVPNYIRAGLQPTCPSDLREKITAWADERYRLGCMFGDVLDALYHLNSTCGDARAMAVLLPALPTIMGAVSDDPANPIVKQGRKLTNLKGCGTLPALPPEVRARVQEVSALVNSVMLIGKETQGRTEIGETFVGMTDMPDHDRVNIFDAGSAYVRTSRFC